MANPLLSFLTGRSSRGIVEGTIPARTLQDVVLPPRTRQTLETSCTNASGASLIDYCREQAEFIKQFPECDSECHSLVVRFTPAPAR